MRILKGSLRLPLANNIIVRFPDGEVFQMERDINIVSTYLDEGEEVPIYYNIYGDVLAIDENALDELLIALDEQ